MTTHTIQPDPMTGPKAIRCALCRKAPTLCDDFADPNPDFGHYELECGCGVMVYAKTLPATVARWNRLMRRAR